MKYFGLSILTSALLWSFPYEESTPLTAVEACQEANKNETTVFFDCMSDGQYSPLYEKRQDLLQNKVSLREEEAGLLQQKQNIINENSLDPILKEELLIENQNNINQNKTNQINNENEFYANEDLIEIKIVIIPYEHNVACEVGDSACESKLEACQPSWTEYTNVMNYCLMPEYEPQLFEKAEHAHFVLPLGKAEEESKDYGDFEKTTVDAEINDPKLEEKASEEEFNNANEQATSSLEESGVNTGAVSIDAENSTEPIDREATNAQIGDSENKAIQDTQGALTDLYQDLGI